MSPVNILPDGGEAFYTPALFALYESERFFRELVNLKSWRQEPIKIFGREVMQPRLTAFYGDAEKVYSYSGRTMHPAAWTTPLFEIKNIVEQETKQKFNCALLNLYRDGNDYMGWHRDNERSLGPDPAIASASFGAERIFQLRKYSGKNDLLSVILQTGSLLLMKGSTQTNWEHRLPKSRTISRPRVNITFRTLV